MTREGLFTRISILLILITALCCYFFVAPSQCRVVFDDAVMQGGSCSAEQTASAGVMNVVLENVGVINEGLLSLMLLITVFGGALLFFKDRYTHTLERTMNAHLSRYGPFYKHCFLPYLSPTHGM